MLLLGNYTVQPILVTNYDKTLCKSNLNLLVSKVLPGFLGFGLEPDGIPTKSIFIRKVQGYTTR